MKKLISIGINQITICPIVEVALGLTFVAKQDDKSPQFISASAEFLP
jgi:hypothetical protein